MQHAAAAAWYAANTQPGQEYAVARRLKRAGHAVLLPETKVRRRFRRVITVTKGPLFLTYLFVSLDLERIEWSVFESTTIGLARILKIDGSPWPISETDMARVRAHAAKRTLITFDERQPVRVDAGPFAGHEGNYMGDGADNDIKIMLEILGCARVVTIPEALVVPA